MTYLGKICPEISSEIVFDKEEWKILCCCARKTKEIPETYTLKEAIYDLGILGGMKGAPSDGMPGARSVWQGLEVLCSFYAVRESPVIDYSNASNSNLIIAAVPTLFHIKNSKIEDYYFGDVQILDFLGIDKPALPF